MVKMKIFMLCIFYHNKKKFKKLNPINTIIQVGGVAQW
jgi:hypothetical protein